MGSEGLFAAGEWRVWIERVQRRYELKYETDVMEVRNVSEV